MVIINPAPIAAAAALASSVHCSKLSGEEAAAVILITLIGLGALLFIAERLTEWIK